MISEDKNKAAALLETLGPEIMGLKDDPSRESFLARHEELLHAAVVEQLAEMVRLHLRVNTTEALDLAEAGIVIARQIQRPDALARSLRAKANALYMSGRNRESVDHHEQALALFRQQEMWSEEGRTLSASIQPLALLGEYDRAHAAVERARQIFTESREDVRLARLDINFANVLHRKDRYAEALAAYERAYTQLWPDKDAEGVAVVLHNMAVCLIALNDFRRALETHERAREFCQQHAMPLLMVQADYNIAWLYYLRGEYGKAIDGLRGARAAALSAGDAYHVALCLMDLSEIYLELNLSEEGEEMARDAFARFRDLGMTYESARCLVNLAIANSQSGKAFRALEIFAEARQLFERESNTVWPALIDLYRVLVLIKEERLAEARRLCLDTFDSLRTSGLTAKATLCQLVLSRLYLLEGDLESSQRECRAAVDRLRASEQPVLSYHAHFLQGQILEARGLADEAILSYEESQRELESLRSSLRTEELKIAFITNKLEVYERLVSLCLEPNQPHASSRAFAYMEQAKSRGLRELILQKSRLMPSNESAQSPLVKRIRDLREELNWYYHRIEVEQLGREARPRQVIEDLERQARHRETELIRVLRDAPQAEPAYELQVSDSIPVARIQAAIPPDTTLVEYYRVGDRLLAALLTRDSLEIVPVTLASRIAERLRMLQFQFSRFRLGPQYTAAFQQSMVSATDSHLRALYQEVLEPIRHGLRGSHLVFVPHDILHYLPFHALHDGERYLIDRYSVSYAPSASVFALCSSKAANTEGSSLVLGISDANAPFILEEVQAVAAVLPKPDLYLGGGATAAVLKEKGRASRYIHIATHGHFRQDNPMFSGVRLGDSYLELFDLYNLHLPVELVTLSGCSTGLNALGAGDELLGLVRGLLYAGALSVVLTMWDVHDRSTSEFMRAFYERLGRGVDKAQALREAILELRERYAHPYYWAPFVLIGKSGGSTNLYLS